MELNYKNVNLAFRGMVEGIANGDIKTVTQQSRNGEVLVIPEPVLLCYEDPTQRVLFSQARDANPFFHLFESLWMIAGKNDVRSVERYSSNIKQFSDDGVVFNGAYGYRWRNALGERVDQLKNLVVHLHKNPESRRAVLQMWNVEDDLLNIDRSKDVCCNTAVYFSIENARLNMTVTNRSNDLIWGMLGANAVHFSFLQEYMAQRIGVGVGKYYQFSNNVHVYKSVWDPDKLLGEYKNRTAYDAPLDYTDAMQGKMPIIASTPGGVIRFEEDLDKFLGTDFEREVPRFNTMFFNNVACPMMKAFAMHKIRRYDLAKLQVERITQKDWRTVAEFWIEKRRANWVKNHVENRTIF